jgi:small subunit ribosomal protein S20
MKTAERDRQRNRKVKTTLRTAVKEFKAKKNSEDKTSEFREISRLVDVATRKGVIHKNKAARTKSRLAKQLKAK